MVRRMLNASRLQQEMSRRIQRVQEVVDDGVRIGVPRPQLQSPGVGGCNWTMKHFGNAAGFEAVIADVLAQMQAEYNLTVGDDAGEAVALSSGAKTTGDDPFGDALPRERVNPFGDERSVKAGDPFASSDVGEHAAASQRKPSRDPFASD